MCDSNILQKIFTESELIFLKEDKLPINKQSNWYKKKKKKVNKKIREYNNSNSNYIIELIYNHNGEYNDKEIVENLELGNNSLIIYKLSEKDKKKNSNSSEKYDTVMMYSKSSIEETLRLINTSPFNVVKEYIDLPILPTNEYLNISKIGVYNWDPIKKKHRGLLTYSLFTDINSDEYPAGKDEQLDYMRDDQVSPILFIDTENNRYKINHLFWYPLTDIHDNILIKQGKTGRKIFPQRIFIDETIKTRKGYSNNWIVELMNLAR